MSNRPLASIVIPSYNHERFVGRAVESALAQTVPDLEVVIVDDGSTDESPAILRAVARDPRVRLLEQENRGAHAAISRGLELARGEHLFILNSDDLYHPTRLEVLLEKFAQDASVAMACSWIDVIDDSGGSLGIKEAWRSLPPWPQPEPGPGLNDLALPALCLLAGNFVATTSNIAFRRDLLERIELAPLRYCHDWDLALQLARLGGLAVVESPLLRYRMHDANTLREGRDQRDGTARMRFEILWVVARHASALLAAQAIVGGEDSDLRGRFWRSMPRFGRLEIAGSLVALEQLLSPAAFDQLVDPAHPLGARWTEALREE